MALGLAAGRPPPGLSARMARVQGGAGPRLGPAAVAGGLDFRSPKPLAASVGIRDCTPLLPAGNAPRSGRLPLEYPGRQGLAQDFFGRACAAIVGWGWFAGGS